MSVSIVERSVERIAIVSSLRGITLMISMMLISAQLLAQPRRKEQGVEHPTFYRTVQVDGLSIFIARLVPRARRQFCYCTGSRLHRECLNLFSNGFLIAITLSRRITPGLVTATGPIQKTSPTPSITMQRS